MYYSDGISPLFLALTTISIVLACGFSQTTQEALETGKMTWSVTWDGASGPIATEWGIRNFPSVYMFDADIKLLASDTPAEYLEEDAKALLNRESNEWEFNLIDTITESLPSLAKILS